MLTRIEWRKNKSYDKWQHRKEKKRFSLNPSKLSFSKDFTPEIWFLNYILVLINFYFFLRAENTIFLLICDIFHEYFYRRCWLGYSFRRKNSESSRNFSSKRKYFMWLHDFLASRLKLSCSVIVYCGLLRNFKNSKAIIIPENCFFGEKYFRLLSKSVPTDLHHCPFIHLHKRV